MLFAVVRLPLSSSSGKSMEKVQRVIECGESFFFNLIQSVNNYNIIISLSDYDKHISAGVLLCLEATWGREAIK